MKSSRELAVITLFIASGAVTRIGFGWIALSAGSLYGVLIKVGLTETLTFLSGFLFGPVQGFVTGALLIVVSDLYMMPGPWTPFIAAIIGLIGIGGGALHILKKNPSLVQLGMSAITLTLVSELLQNTWFAVFFGLPIEATLLMGVPSTATALVNNTILFTTVVPRVVRLMRQRGIVQPIGDVKASQVS